MKTAVVNMISATVCALVGVAIWVTTDLTVRGDGLGLFHTDARLFPHFIAFMIVATSIGWFARSIAGYRKAKTENGGTKEASLPVEWGAYSRVALVVVVFFAYAQAIRPLGFALSSFLAGMAALMILKEKKPLLYACVGGSILLLYAVFKYLLKVRLP